MEKNSSVLKIRSSAGDEKTTEGLVYVQHLNKAQRLQKAILVLLAWWAGALGSVLIPVVHFISVPILFCLGVFFFLRTQKSQGRVLRGEVPCAHCQYKVLIKPQQLHWPLKEICQSCARVQRMEQIS